MFLYYHGTTCQFAAYKQVINSLITMIIGIVFSTLSVDAYYIIGKNILKSVPMK